MDEDDDTTAVKVTFYKQLNSVEVLNTILDRYDDRDHSLGLSEVML